MSDLIETWRNDFKAFVNSLNLSRDDYKTMMEYIDELSAVQPDHVADIGKKAEKEDCISRQTAIDLFPNDALEWDTKGGYIAPHLARRMIEELPSAQPEWKKDEWIPISKETNPTKSGWYLVTVHEDATNDNERFTGMAEFNAINGMWYDIDEPTDMYLRWMPLPEPYRGGEK